MRFLKRNKHFGGDEEIAMPRVSAVRRQQNRANPDVSNAIDYYRVTVYNTFLDCLLQQLEDRFQPATQTAMMLSALLPKYVVNGCINDIKKRCNSFHQLIARNCSRR